MSFNESLISSGVIGAIAFSIVLFTSKNNRRANIFLAFLIIALAFDLSLSWILHYSIYNQYPALHILPFGIGFGLGPLLFLYAKSLTTDRSVDIRHLWWLLADYPHSIYHLVVGRGVEHVVLHEVLDKMGVLSILVIAYYLLKTRNLIKAYQHTIKNNLSNIEQQTLRWINQLISVFLVSLPVYICIWMVLIFFGLDFDNRMAAHLIHTVTIFWLGIGGVKQPEVILGFDLDREREQPEVNPRHIEMLVDCMENDKLYLIPDLNIRYLEERLNLKAKQISEALNQGLGKNFYSFINEYRVNEFKRKSKESTNLTLAGLALECGFNSKSTFQRVFKEITGASPSQYLDQQK